MLVISRKVDEKIKIGDEIEIIIISIEKNQVRIGIEAPKHIPILRNELIEEIKKENIKASKYVNIEIIKSFIKGK